MKTPRNDEITLAFTDVGKSCLSCKILALQICLLTLFAKIKFSRKFPDLQLLNQSKRIRMVSPSYFLFEGYQQMAKVGKELISVLTLNASMATKVVCFSRLLKCVRSLYGKQCGPKSDCSYRSSLFWVHTVCFYT